MDGFYAVWRRLAVTGLVIGLVTAHATAAEGPGNGIQVIGAGPGRTGTESLRDALNQLGYKTYHMFDNLDAGDRHMKYWVPLARGDPGAEDSFIDNVLLKEGYNATTDFPACHLYTRLAERFPDAKVILSVRDTPEVWASSVRTTIGRLGALDVDRLPMSLMFPAGFTLLNHYIWNNFGGGVKRLPNGTLVGLEQAYTRWIADVKATIPPERLLVHNAKDGWGPICDILGLVGDACPSTPYPRSNPRVKLATLADVCELLEATWPWLGIVTVLVVGWIIRGVLRQCRRWSSKPKLS